MLHSKLEKIAPAYRRIARQAEVLSVFAREIPNHIEKNSLFAVLVTDTVIAENYKDASKCLAWLTLAHRAWLNENHEFNRMAERLIIYRYILLPYPSLITNWQKRRRLIDIILLHLHLQLWHGVICGVVFLDPRKTNIARVLNDLNFLSIPSHNIFFEAPAFYNGDNLKTIRYSNNQANMRYRAVNQMLSTHGSDPLWLHYDEANFSGERLSGWRWNMLRQFFRRLYGPDVVCTECHAATDTFALDHIAPISQGYYQTIINFSPLCKRCNSSKSDITREDPFKVKILLPTDLQTRELDDIQRQPPQWLGKVRSPTSLRDLTARILE